MPKFSYTAKSFSGEEKNGKIDAKDVRQLATTLKVQGFLLISAVAEKEDEEKNILNINIPFLSRVSLVDKLMFTRNLQVMISSGLSLPKSLQVLALQGKSKLFRKAILEIKEEIIKGNNFSDSLKKYPNIFSELFQNMIKVGEEAGNLEEVLGILSKQMERENELKSKIKGALMYPAVIVSAMIIIGILMLVMVVPNIAETFEDLGIELPITTQFIIGLGTFMAEKWYLSIVFIVILIGFYWFGLQSKKVKKGIDGILLKLPIISTLIKKTNSATTARTLSSLISAGVPIVRSLEIVSNTLGNFYYKKALSKAGEKVKKGGKLSDALSSYKDIYPIIVIQMIKVGEETGETSSILAKLADFFEEEVGNATKNMASIIEPVLMLIVGAVIGFFAISMVQPMYSMLDAI
ncbi:MAG: type II secretion system F family protein [Candidatus Nealsonbacteria bacterium]